MKFKFYFLTSFVLFFILQNQVFCQNSADPILPIEVKEPKSPTTSSLLKYIDFGSLGNNGSPGIDIPLYQIQLKSLSLPISLSYNATGIKVADEAGNVGLNWNLIAGGLISRSIIDKEDNGTYWSDVYSGVTNGLNPTSGLAGYNLGMGIAFGNLDGAPDIYSYNFPGESGKFLNIIGNGIKLIPKKNILIKQTTPNAEDPTQLNYEIITGDGTQYYFEALEKTVTRTLSSVSKSGYTFYLTKIKSATNDDEITFTYVNTHYELLPNVGESSSHTLNCHSVDYVTGSYTPVNSNVGIDGKQLSMINYPSGSVEFKLDWNREDRSNNVLINIIKVDGLVIRNSNQEIIQEIDLLYDYYNAQSTSNYLKRLRLNKIAFKPSPVPGTNSPQYSYRFDYEQTPLPNLFSKSIDHWGYYNGKNNNTIIPDYGLPTLNCHTTLPYCPCINPSNNHFIFHGGNREVDPVYSKAGILNKITYPTGGYCVFDYESNEVAPTQEVGSNSINIPVSITSNSANGIFVDDATTPTAVFASNTLTSNGVCGRVHITYGYPPNTDPILLDHYKPYAVLSEYDVATNSTSIIHTLYLDGVELSKDYDFTLLPNKQYTVLVYTQLQNSTISANLTYNLPYSFTQTHLVGGLRLKEKNIYDRINSQPIVTKYQYSPAGVRQPKYVSENKDWIFEVSECNPTGCWRIGSYDSDGRGIFENNTLNDNISLSAYYKSIDPGTNYFEIKTILGSNGENGSIITDYEIDNMSAPSEASDSWRVGKVLDEISYNSDGDIIKKVHNEYLTESTSTENYPGISYSSIVFPTCLSADFPSYQSFINANGTTPHPASSVWFHQKSTSETIYDIHGQNGVTTSHEYFYENPNHYELTKEKSINSDGSEIINIIRYAQDYNLNLNSADPEITTLKLMGNPIGLHYTGIPIEKIQKKTINGLSYISSGSLITFQQLNSLQTALVPKTVYSIETDNPIPTSSFSSSYTSSTGFLLDSHYKKYFNYDLYDKYGNILITHKENNTNNLIIYLDAGQKPVASFSNSSKGNTSIAADATFCGFEGIQNTNGSFESNDYWNIAPSTLVKDNQTLGTIDIHTGNKSQRVNPYVASANRIISPPNRMQKFRYSAWFYFNGTPSGSASLLAQVLDQNGNPYANGKFETTISFTDGKWIYVENIIDLGEYISSLNPVPSNISLKLSTENKMNEAYYWDDVRFQPYYSNAQTYTYDKLFNQISSVSDERSTPTYFRYDDFGKLKFTNDFNRNLIKYDKYQYDQIAGMNNTITECIFLHSGVSDNTAVSGNLAKTDQRMTIQYLDGLGRPSQNIQWMGSPSGGDIIQPSVYDEYGRESTKFLPYVDAINHNGDYKINWNTDQQKFYQNTFSVSNSDYPFAETSFETSPLGRVISEGAPGIDWSQGNGHTKTEEYKTNQSTEILLWKVTSSSGIIDGASNSGCYPPNTLNKTISADENGHRIIEFKDLQGRLICKQSEVLSETPQGGTVLRTRDFTEGSDNINPNSNAQLELYSTYYVYNDLGQLSFVIPPAASFLLRNNIQSFNASSQIFKDYIYAYRYDSRGRECEKKIPGCEWKYTVYNKLNFPVLTQDGNQQSSKQWTFKKYDVLGREVITGICEASGSRQIVQNLVNNNDFLWETRISNGYTTNAYPTNPTEILTTNYYDDYNFSFDADLSSQNYSNTIPDNKVSGRTEGLLAATKVKILGTSNDYLRSINYYDEKANVIEQHQQHQLSFDWDLTASQFDFINQPIKSVRVHNKPGNNPRKFYSRYNYDHFGRGISTFQKCGDYDPEVELSFNTYNELGQLIKKELDHSIVNFNSEALQHIDYRYNIRGWLTSINNGDLTNDGTINFDDDDAFGEEILYNDVTGFSTHLANVVPIPQYNGNISVIKWKVKAPNASSMIRFPHAYVYRYDDINRMTAAYYVSDRDNVGVFDKDVNYYKEIPVYDIMGNILSMDRNSKAGNIDNLIYEYSGNQLLNVSDHVTHVFTTGFTDGATAQTEYTYDLNGNNITDLNKGISMTFNYLNLPVTVNKQGVGQIVYTYDATGKKLTKLFNGKKHEYLNGIEYDDDVFQFINTEEGRARPMGTSGINNQEYVYDYFLKDHLGNIRVILSSEVTRERYFATMENQNASVEEQTFENIPETRDDLPFGYPVDSTYSPNQKVSVLNKADNKTIGHAKVLEVKQGEKLDFDTKYFFTGNSFVPGNTTPINDILSQLANIFILSPASSIAGDELAKKQQWAQQTFINNSDVSTFLSSSLSNSDPDFLNKPKAFLVWIFFDKSFKFIPEASGVKQVFNADQLGELAVLDQDMPENGYFYIYVSNESEKEVNFDNLRISQTSGSFVEENHYYPFGMLIEDLSTSVSKGQKYKYNGKELQTDLNYNVEDYGARHYDPVIARWMHVDPLAEKYRRWSPYNYAVDNPVRFIDPDGMQVGNNNQPAKTENNGKPIVPTTAKDNTATSVVDTKLKDVTKSKDISDWRFPDFMGNHDTWDHGVVIEGESSNSNKDAIKATGSVLKIESSTIELFQTLIDYGGLGPTGKPSSEEVVTDKRSVSNEPKEKVESISQSKPAEGPVEKVDKPVDSVKNTLKTMDGKTDSIIWYTKK